MTDRFCAWAGKGVCLHIKEREDEIERLKEESQTLQALRIEAIKIYAALNTLPLLDEEKATDQETAAYMQGWNEAISRVQAIVQDEADASEKRDA